MRGLGFYDEYFKLMGNLKDKPDLATPYKIKYLKKFARNVPVESYYIQKIKNNITIIRRVLI